MFNILMNVLWLVVSVLLILVVLVQRGKGGGLAGALGGMGGSSAFGTRAGDLFTKITVGIFLVWLLIAMVLVKGMATQESRYDNPVASDGAPGSAPSLLQDGLPVPESTDASNVPLGKATDSGAGSEAQEKAASAPQTTEPPKEKSDDGAEAP